MLSSEYKCVIMDLHKKMKGVCNMKEIKLTNSTKIIIILSIIAVFMYPVRFFGRCETGVYMECWTDWGDLDGLLLWIFYIAFAVTDISMIFKQNDLAKFSSSICVAALAGSILWIAVDYGDGDFYRHFNIGAYVCTFASVIAALTVKKEASKK